MTAMQSTGSAAAAERITELRTRVKRLGDGELDLLFREARSMNTFTSRSVAEELLREMVSLTQLGPTSNNCQPARFVFVRTPDGRQRLLQAVSPGNTPKVLSAPVTVIVGHDLGFFDHLRLLFPHRDTSETYRSNPGLAGETAFRNGSLQGAYMMLAARSLGLDAGPISGFDNGKVDELFFQGTAIKSNFLCNLGYGDERRVFERHPRLDFDSACAFA